MELIITSDQTIVADLLREIAHLCASYGARWNSELQIEVNHGCMRLLAPPGTSSQLIKMPTELLVPIGGAQWSTSADVLKLLQPAVDTTPVQRKLLQLHIELYNATSKLSWWSNQHPARLCEISRDLAAPLEQLKPAFRSQAKYSAAERFLATRSFNWRFNPEQNRRHPVLMPLIDLLNHHHQGAPYRIYDGAMQIKAMQAGGRECFAYYGNRRDVLDLALHYGHFDLSTPFAHSAPLEIEIAGIGNICIEDQVQRVPLHPFDPPRVTLEPDGVRLSHLCFHLDHPDRVQKMFGLAMQAHLRRRGHIVDSVLTMVQSGLSAIGRVNLHLLKQLAAAAQDSFHPSASLLVAAAQRQSSIIKTAI